MNWAAKMEAMYNETVRYARERMVFGKPLIAFQNTRFKLAEIKTRTTAVRMMVDQYLVEHLKRKLTLQEAAMAKLFATEELGKALDEMLQLYGGYGFMLEYPVARAFADGRIQTIYGGTTEIMKEIIGRDIAQRHAS